MLNFQLEIVGEQFVTSIGPSDEFYVNLLFDRCAHIIHVCEYDIVDPLRRNFQVPRILAKHSSIPNRKVFPNSGLCTKI